VLQACSKKEEVQNPIVTMKNENYGTIKTELYPKYASNTVAIFNLIEAGFYDNNSFHRLSAGFVLQGGDPDGMGTGGPGYAIKGEFSLNNYSKNTLSHTAGVISMARSTDKDSAGSQFFIVLEDSTDLDEQYATFGRVIDGWDNIEAIVKNENIKDTQTGKLARNLVIKKSLIDLKEKEYKEVEKISK